MKTLTLAVIVGLAASISACGDNPAGGSDRITAADIPLVENTWPYTTAIRPGSVYTLATFGAQFLPQAAPNGDTIVGGTMKFVAPTDSINNVFHTCYKSGDIATERFTYTSDRFGRVNWNFINAAPDTGRTSADGSLAYYRDNGAGADLGYGLNSGEVVTCAPHIGTFSLTHVNGAPLPVLDPYSSDGRMIVAGTWEMKGSGSPGAGNFIRYCYSPTASQWTNFNYTEISGTSSPEFNIVAGPVPESAVLNGDTFAYNRYHPSPALDPLPMKFVRVAAPSC